MKLALSRLRLGIPGVDGFGVISAGLRCWHHRPQETIPVRDVNGSGEPGWLHCVAPGDVDYPVP